MKIKLLSINAIYIYIFIYLFLFIYWFVFFILCVCTSSRKSMKFMNLHGNFPSWAGPLGRAAASRQFSAPGEFSLLLGFPNFRATRHQNASTWSSKEIKESWRIKRCVQHQHLEQQSDAPKIHVRINLVLAFHHIPSLGLPIASFQHRNRRRRLRPNCTPDMAPNHQRSMWNPTLAPGTHVKSASGMFSSVNLQVCWPLKESV